MNKDESFGEVERDGPRCRLFHRNTNNDLSFQASCLACANEILNCYIRIPNTHEPDLCAKIKDGPFPNFQEIVPSLAQITNPKITANPQAPKHLKLQQRPADTAKSIFECRTTLIQETIKKHKHSHKDHTFIREFTDAIEYFQKQFDDLTAVGEDDLKKTEATTVTNWALVKGNLRKSTQTKAILERNDDLQLYNWSDNITLMNESAKKETLEVTLIDDFHLLTFVTEADHFEQTLIKEGIAMVRVYKREMEKERGKIKTGFPVWVSPTSVAEPTSSQPSTSRSKKKKDTELVNYTATLELNGAVLGGAEKALYFIPWPMLRCSTHFSKFNKFPFSANYSNVYAPAAQCAICKMHFTYKGASTSTETMSEEDKPKAIDGAEVARCHGNQRHDICVLCGLGFLIKKFTKPNQQQFPKDSDFRGWPSSYCFICTLYRFEHGTRSKLDFRDYKTTKMNYMKLYDKLYDATKDTEGYADDVLQAWNNMHSMKDIVSHKAFEEIARQYKHCQDTAQKMRSEPGGRMPKTSLVRKREVLCVCNSFSPYQFPAHHKDAPKELMKLHGWKPWTNLGIPKSGQQTKETYNRHGNVSVSVFDEMDYWITEHAALENKHDGVTFPLVTKPKNVKKQQARAPDRARAPDGNKSRVEVSEPPDLPLPGSPPPGSPPPGSPPPGSPLGSPLTWLVELFEQTLEENGIGVRDVEDDYGNSVRVYSQTVNDDTVLWEIVPSDEAIEPVFFHDGVKIHPPVEPPLDEKKWTPARRVWIRKEQNGKKADLTPREVFTESNLSLNPLKSYEEETTKIKIFPTKDTRHAPKLYWWRRAKEGDRKAPKGYMNITTNERVYAPSVGWVPAVLGHLEEDNHNDELKDYSEQEGKKRGSDGSARASPQSKKGSKKSKEKKKKSGDSKLLLEKMKKHVEHRFELLEALIKYHSEENEPLTIEIDKTIGTNEAKKYWRAQKAKEEHKEFCAILLKHITDLAGNYEHVVKLRNGGKPDDPKRDWVNFVEVSRNKVKVWGSNSNNHKPADNDQKKDIDGSAQVQGIKDAFEERQRTDESMDESNNMAGLFAINTSPTEDDGDGAPDEITSDIPWWFPNKLKNKLNQKRKEKTPSKKSPVRKEKPVELLKEDAQDPGGGEGPPAPLRRPPDKDQPEMKAAHRLVKLKTGKVVSMGYTMIKVLSDDEDDPHKYKKPLNHEVLVLQDYGPEKRKKMIDEVIGKKEGSICKGLANAYYDSADPNKDNYIGELHYELQHGDVMLKQKDNKAFVILKCITSSQIARSHLLPWNKKAYGYISLICTKPGLGTQLMNEVETYVRSQRPKICQIVLCSILERIQWYARDELGYVLANANTLEISLKTPSIVYGAKLEYSKGDYIKSEAPSGDDAEETTKDRERTASKVVHPDIIHALSDKWNNRTIKAVIESLCGLEAFHDGLPEELDGGTSLGAKGSVRRSVQGKRYEVVNAEGLDTPMMTSPSLMPSSLRGLTQAATPAATPRAATPADRTSVEKPDLFVLEKALRCLYDVVDDKLRSGTYNEITLFKVKKHLEGLGLPVSIIIRMETPNEHTSNERKDELFYLTRKRMVTASNKGTAPLLYWHDHMKGYIYKTKTKKIYNKHVLMDEMNISYKELLTNLSAAHGKRFQVVPGPFVEVSIMEAMEESIAEVLTREGFRRHWRKETKMTKKVNDNASAKAFEGFVKSHADRLDSNKSVQNKHAQQSLKLAPMVAQRLRELVNLFPGFLHACFDTAPRNFVCSEFFDTSKNSLTVRSIDIDNQFCIGFLEISTFKLLMTKEDINQFELIRSWLESCVPLMDNIASPVETKKSARLPSTLPAPTKEELRDAMYVLCLALTASTFFNLIKIHIKPGVKQPNLFYDFACKQAKMIKKSLFLAWGIMCTLNLTRSSSAYSDLTLKCTIPEYKEYFKSVSTKKMLSELLTANHEKNKEGYFWNPVEIPDKDDTEKTRIPLLKKIVEEKHKHSRISTDPFQTFIAMIELLFARHLVVKRTNVSELK